MDEAGRDALKHQAAEYAVRFVQSGMIVGLGTGSTAIHATRRIAALVREGTLRDVVGFATSRAVWEQALRLGLPMLTEDMPRAIDLTIDGADEIDPDLNLIKGGGGALLREKIAAQASARVVIVADNSKLSPRLGTHWAVPVEVLDFGWQANLRFLTALGAQVTVRRGKRTDQGNMILDCQFGPIHNAADLARKLDAHAGIVAHGLFLNLAHEAIIAGPDGIQHIHTARQTP